MPEFKKPKLLKKANRIVGKNGNVLEVSHLEYDVDDKKYPKLHISIHRQDEDGFPQGRPKSLNLPIDMTPQLIKALQNLD